jgi:DNA-binding CsgD family transcriptional regulator
MKKTIPKQRLLNAIFSAYQGDDADPKFQFELVKEIIELLGYEHAIYKCRRPFPLAEPRYDTFHNLSVGVANYEDSLHSHRNSLIRFWRKVNPESETTHWGWTTRLDSTVNMSASLVALSTTPHPEDSELPIYALIAAHLSHWLLSRALGRERVGKYSLSSKEREVLRWTADGKTSGDIALLLSVSENTINFHHKNIKEKLVTSTKTSSAVYAATLGLLS